jgi:hypothetical protein
MLQESTANEFIIAILMQCIAYVCLFSSVVPKNNSCMLLNLVQTLVSPTILRLILKLLMFNLCSSSSHVYDMIFLNNLPESWNIDYMTCGCCREFGELLGRGVVATMSGIEICVSSMLYISASKVICKLLCIIRNYFLLWTWVFGVGYSCSTRTWIFVS